MTIRTQTELMIRRIQFIRRTKEATTQAVCTENARGYHLEYGNSRFNNRENNDAYDTRLYEEGYGTTHLCVHSGQTSLYLRAGVVVIVLQYNYRLLSAPKTNTKTNDNNTTHHE